MFLLSGALEYDKDEGKIRRNMKNHSMYSFFHSWIKMLLLKENVNVQDKLFPLLPLSFFSVRIITVPVRRATSKEFEIYRFPDLQFVIQY